MMLSIFSRSYEPLHIFFEEMSIHILCLCFIGLSLCDWDCRLTFNKVLFLCFDSFYHLCSSSIVWSSWQSNSADAVIVPLDSCSWRRLHVRVLLSFYGSSPCWAHLWRHWESPRNARQWWSSSDLINMVKLLWFNCFFENRNRWCNMIFRLIKILVKYLEFAKQ